ncbi:Bax inhibitor-1/YccA family protein [Methylococcus geothermalis]|uniref:BAX inhibitor (BI)-1/YccA family protein n=1 Tax=Methylococcus geothermalis TaxID=2681310 RepID=A0A858Q9D0_9GAMM|nr:Bax inhibitor-1/YccA family protein [Methylococcus geothermalis]QJD30479.1 BAX inhibitor (BI)-1/YccA family protein [Methylococcus geothermalis]
MSTPREQVVSRGVYAVVPRHKVLTNTYALLSLTLLFSAVTAGASMALALPHPGIVITLVGYFGLLWLINKFSNSAVGILWVFALTGFMGYTLGPILNAYVTHFANGTQLVMMAMGGTGAVFLGLSAYALTSRKDFGFLGGMLAAGILVAFLAGLVAAFVPGLMGLSLAVSAMFVVLMAGMILFQTSAIIHGGETNYILATVSLYVTIFNLFTSLLQLLGVFNSDD